MDCKIQVTEKHYGAAAHRPDLYGICIEGRRGKLLSALYTAAGNGPHPTVILLHGIPGCEQNYDLAQTLRRRGFHVMTFHYSGNWGSDGTYSLRNDLEDAETVLDFVLKDETYGFDKARIYAVGHSMGGYVCGQLTARRSEIRGGVLLMPCDIGRISRIAEENAEAAAVLQEVLEESAQWLRGVTGEALKDEAEQYSEQLRLEPVAGKLAGKPLLCITGTLDVCTPKQYHGGPLVEAILAAGGVKVEELSFPTDHFFSDYRLTVAERVAEFLEAQVSGTISGTQE
ncbi:MAG: alpha/beta fold hydrolase [Lachnospiraceae bacterium]|nr:alpha/beta fold hydrolase [Lachnospiraceae bacterium]